MSVFPLWAKSPRTPHQGCCWSRKPLFSFQVATGLLTKLELFWLEKNHPKFRPQFLWSKSAAVKVPGGINWLLSWCEGCFSETELTCYDEETTHCCELCVSSSLRHQLVKSENGFATKCYSCVFDWKTYVVINVVGKFKRHLAVWYL